LDAFSALRNDRRSVRLGRKPKRDVTDPASIDAVPPGAKSTGMSVSAEIRNLRRILGLAGREKALIGLIIMLAMMSAFFEGLGLSLLIPLVEVVTGETNGTDIPFVGTLLAWFGGTDEPDPVMVVAVILGAFVAGILISFVNMIVSNVLAIRLAHNLRLSVFDQVLTRPLSDVEGASRGKLINNIWEIPWQVCDAVFVIIGALVNLVFCLVFLSFLLSLSTIYTLALVLLTLVTASLVHLATRAVHALGLESKNANESFLSLTWEVIGGLRTIRAFGREGYEGTRFSDSSSRLSNILLRFKIRSGLVAPISQTMNILVVGVLLAIALGQGDSISLLIGFLAIAYRLQPRVAEVLGARTALQGFAAPIEEMVRALEPSPRRREGRNGMAIRQITDGIVFEDVTVRYPDAAAPSLSDVTCTIKRGEVTAVLGRSGAGKSTLASVLMRFTPPSEGRVRVDGVDLDEIDPTAWHDRIAVVEQNAFLFNASVYECIRYGDLSASRSAIEAAACAAEADDFIRDLPHGYETRIGDTGVQLSHGQRQRIALARALLRNPALLILDEATNALDRPTDLALRNAIRKTRADRVTLVISHRRETIETADHVVILDAGRVIEQGTPSDLAARDGVYAALFNEESRIAQDG